MGDFDYVKMYFECFCFVMVGEFKCVFKMYFVLVWFMSVLLNLVVVVEKVDVLKFMVGGDVEFEEVVLLNGVWLVF